MSPATSSFLAVAALASPAFGEQVLWRFDNLHRIGGHEVLAEGRPRLVRGPDGRAVQFDGEGSSLLVRGRPLVGASSFTVEVVLRPNGGAFEQRFLHIAESDPATGLDVTTSTGPDRNNRIMFEIRVSPEGWYPDAFVKSAAGTRPLIFPRKVHPIGRWYAVAQTYDGTTYRLYVDGELQGEAPVAFSPQGAGRVRVGARMNRLDYFKGLIAEARFTDRALRPDEMLRAPGS